jgi:GT2 family glycosyltransferase
MHLVVVLNWHGRDDTVACVRSILAGDADTRVLLVDNGSFDGALAAFDDTDRVQALQLPRNLGFSGGMNRGIERAIAEGAEVVTILNNDTVVPSGAMAQLAALAEGPVALSPTVMYRDEPERVWFAGGTLDMPDGYPHHTALDELTPCADGLRETELLAGCCITASVEIWQRAGLFDERFFLNFEDSEWSLRARGSGIRLLVACDVRIQHAVSASFTGAAATLGAFYYLRNGLLFSKITGTTTAARLRFLRRFGLRGLRHSSWQDRRRALVIGVSAACAYLFGRFGEAPAGVRRKAERWIGSPD